MDTKKKGFWQHIKEEEKLNIKISEFLEKKADDPISHLAKISNYLVKQVHKRLYIVIDNADQLDEEIQKEVFILGHSFHRNLKVMTLISLREGYFYKFKNKPPFDAYHSTVFHITAPPYREVLDKRIKYVLQHFKFQSIKIVLDNYKAQLGEGSLNSLFSNLYTVLFERTNSEILSFLEETSYPNIRNGLEKFKFFLLSGHTKTNMYMSFEYGKDGKNNIPIWEFIKSVALESNYYYQTNRSVLFNIYYPSTNNKNHFTKIRLLDYIIDNNSGVSKKNNFILVSSIINDFIKAGYNTEVILEELNLLHSNGLIFTNDYASDVEEQTTLDFSNEIGITPAGTYYLKNLLNTFLYYDLVLQDTPIYNDKYFDEITAVFPECDGDGNRNLSGRVKTTELFINYLLEQENLDHNRKEGTYGIKCLDRQIIKSFKENGLKTDLQRLENALTKLSQNIA